MTLKRYLTEAELAAVQPVTGDEFDISLREITNIETVVVEHTDGAIMIDLDDAAMKMLEECGCTFEEDEQLDEIWPVLGAIAGRIAGGAAGRALAGTAGRAIGGITGSMAGKEIGNKLSSDDEDVEEAQIDDEDQDYEHNEGDIVRVDYPTEHDGQLGQVVELSPSKDFAYVEFKDGSIESYHMSDLVRVTDDEADAYLDQEEIDELAPIKALAGLGSKMAQSAPSKTAGRIIKSAGKAIDKKVFGPRPHEEDYEESINGVRRLAGMPTAEAASGHDKTHGGPYDRGSADAYYGRPSRPHKMVPYTGSDAVKGQMQKVALTDPAEIAAYNAGYAEEDDRKDYGESTENINEIQETEASQLIAAARKMFPDKSHPVHKSVNDLIYSIGYGRGNADKYADEIRKHINGESVMPEGIEDMDVRIASIPRTEPFKLKKIVVKSPGGKTYTFDTEEDARRLFLDKWNVVKDPKSGWKIDMNNVKPTDEGRFEEPMTGWKIVSKKDDSVVKGHKFDSKEAAQKHLMTKMFANHQDYKVVSFGEDVNEAEYQGRKVALGKPMQGDVKKFKVYVKDPSTGNVKKVNFGDPNMRIKKSNPARRKSFRARHNCANPGPRTSARYWSCRKW